MILQLMFDAFTTGHNSPSINSWKLDPLTLKFQLKGALPYSPELLEPQPGLLRYILKQPYSREIVCTVIEIQKKVKCNSTQLVLSFSLLSY